jgi:hypothetical protein
MPWYTLAVDNVGVACLNLGAYQEAVEHFLGGLAMQGDSVGAGGVDAAKRSEQLWSTLRRTLVAMVSVHVDYYQASSHLTFRIVRISLARPRTETWTYLGPKGLTSDNDLRL